MNKNYTGIDYFRFIAALLIIAIHTSPLGSFSETGNFIFTRIVSRVAVPFFFMTSGFFLISRYTCNAEKLEAFIKKTTLIYGVAAFSLKHIKVAGIFTHLCAADSLEENDVAFTNKQIGTFYKVLDWLKSSGLNIPKVHIQSSYGLLNYPELECDYIRVGVALYGVLSSTNDKAKLELDLRPVLSLKAKVVLIRKIKQGESVGYSRAFTATRDSLIAILPIGYADGFPRNLSCGNSYALIGGRQAPIVGKICMDQLAVDVTDIPNVKTGSIATLIGKDGKEEITAPMVAESAESITNELLSRMGHRLNIIRRA